MRDLRTLPKVELHLHVEGSVRASTLREWADRDGKTTPHGLGPDDVWRFTDPPDFIRNYTELCALMGSLEDFHRAGEELCEDLAANGVRYAEAVFSPSNHAPRFGGDRVGPLEAILDGLAAGERATGVRVRLCPDVVRDMGPGEGEHVVELAIAYADRGVIGLNGAGSERTDVEAFAHLFHRAKDAGLASLPHAGEWAGPENIRATIAHYRPDRIGHGITAIDDPALVRELADRALPLEISPVSNVATGASASFESHPFMALRDAGVVVTLNSDDPPMFGAWLADVYERARDTWGLGDAELAELARTAVRTSFADEDRKRGILRDIDGWIGAPEVTTTSEGRPA
jgi:adenosine deaminase